MGALGGFLWHFAKGWRNSPKYEKFNGAMFSGTLKSPAVGSAFATWGGIFCAFDCTLAYARGGKEDSWNPVLAGAATGGVLSMRSGWKSCARNAVVGGVLLGIIEVVQIVSSHIFISRRSFAVPVYFFPLRGRRVLCAHFLALCHGWFFQMFLRGTPAITPRKQFQQMKEYEEMQQRQAQAGSSPSLWSRLLPTTPAAAPQSQPASELLHDSATLR